MPICGRYYADGTLICRRPLFHAGNHETGHGAMWPDSSSIPRVLCLCESPVRFVVGETMPAIPAGGFLEIVYA